MTGQKQASAPRFLPRLRGRNLTLALLLLTLAALPAASAPAPASDGQIPDLVSELIVQSYTPGPAWWRVTHEGATVWILGTPPYLPNSNRWDRKAFDRRLKGADQLITPLYLTLQPYRIAANGAPILEPDGFVRPGETVADLPSDTQARLRAALKTLGGKPPADGSSIIYATRQLNQALFERVPLSATALATLLNTAANFAKVPVKLTRLSTVEVATDYAAGPVGPKIDCLEATLAVAERGPNPLRAGLDAWGAGDLPSAMATVGCVGAKGRVYQQEAVVVTAMIESYLRDPGKARKSVAAVELIPLLMRGGVIQRLQAAGFTIEAPDSAALATGE